jgi:hypothetical protein
MGCASLLLGIISLGGVLLGLLPLANILNCIILPIALVGAIFGLVDLVRVRRPGESKGQATFGLILNGLALLIGTTRFFISLISTGGIL